MANARSARQTSDSEGATRSPESVFPQPQELADANGQNAQQLDPKGMLQAAVNWAAGVTDAHGAAIAIGDARGMRCCASFGNAPIVGAPVSGTSGLSGICLRTAKFVECEDTETDSRVDAAVCRQLHLRSVLIVPVLVDGSLKALIEVFSSKPHAFNARHRQDLSRMAETLGAMLADRDSKPAATAGHSASEQTTFSPPLGAVANPVDQPVVTVAPSLTSTNAAPATPAPTASPAAVAAELPIPPPSDQTGTVATAMAASAGVAAPSPPTGRRLSPASRAGIGAVLFVLLLAAGWYLAGRHSSAPVATNARSPALQQASTPAAGAEVTFEQNDLSLIAPQAEGRGRPSSLAPGKLIRRVEPVYPPAARDSGIGGSVVLTAVVNREGAVENVNVVRGPEPLAEATAEAVRQWVYEPYRRNGEPIAVQTTIIVKFTPKRP